MSLWFVTRNGIGDSLDAVDVGVGVVVVVVVFFAMGPELSSVALVELYFITTFSISVFVGTDEFNSTSRVELKAGACSRYKISWAVS